MFYSLSFTSFLRIMGYGLFLINAGLCVAESRTESKIDMIHSLDTLKMTMDLGSQTSQLPVLKDAVDILFAASTEPECPLNNARSLVKPTKQGDPAQHAREILLHHLNQAETKLVLLEGKDDGRGFQPERGEDSETNWIFSLVIPSLSDHIYWIVIPKTEKPQTSKGYVYGFN